MIKISPELDKFLQDDNCYDDSFGELRKNFLIENKVIPYLNGFTYNGTTVLTVELMSKNITDDIETDAPLTKGICGKDYEFSQLNNDEKKIFHIYNFFDLGMFDDVYKYPAIRFKTKENCPSVNELQNAFLYLLQSINWNKFSLNELYVNRKNKDSMELEEDESIKVFEFPDAFFSVQNDSEYIYGLSSCLVKVQSFINLYKILELRRETSSFAKQKSNFPDELLKEIKTLTDEYLGTLIKDDSKPKHEDYIFKAIRNGLQHGKDIEIQKIANKAAIETENVLKRVLAYWK